MRKYLKDIGINIKDGCVPGGGDVSTLTDERADRLNKQIEEYGFDDRETWNLNFTSACWLYEHLMMFKEIGGEVVDLSFYKFTVDTVELNRELTCELFEELRASDYGFSICDTVRKELTQEECIDTIIDYLKYYILVDEVDEDCSEDELWNKPAEISILEEMVAVERVQAAIKIYADIMPSMWW